MLVEIWSDLICPWCGLGQHRLAQALAAFEHRDHVEVVHRSFQLDPSFQGGEVPVREMLARKYRVGPAQLEAMFRRVESLAEADGLRPYVVGDNVVGNTRLAHELLAMASERGPQDVAWERLYRAYFGERRSIFGIDALVELAPELGLDGAEVRDALRQGRYRERVTADDEEARALGATGVPFIVVDRRVAVAGAQPVPALLRMLEDAWSESKHAAAAQSAEGVCGPDGCTPSGLADAPGES